VTVIVRICINMADIPTFKYFHEPEYERKQSDNMLGVGPPPSPAQENEQRASRQSSRLLSIDPGLDKSRAISGISIDPRRGSGADYDSEGDERQEIGLEEQLARDRIRHLHDVFVSAQGSEGLSMQEFRSAMRQVMLTESGREMEDDEIDKVSVTLFYARYKLAYAQHASTT